jgi:Ca2+-binding RTX toxin-like protein
MNTYGKRQDLTPCSFYGNAGDDTLAGGLGNEILTGGNGSDTYVFNRGDGQDVITDLGDTAAVDILQFGADILQSDVTFSRTIDGGLVITLNGSTDSVTIPGWDTNVANRIERFVFAHSTGSGQATGNAANDSEWRVAA